jgi:hypothetical protein
MAEFNDFLLRLLGRFSRRVIITVVDFQHCLKDAHAEMVSGVKV